MSEKMKTDPAAAVKRPLGLYLHIPFCKRKCLYCDFLSAPATDSVIAAYVDGLCLQLEAEAPNYREYSVRTIFFGGGTPSLLTVLQIQRLMDEIRLHFDVSEDAEITMESNPGTLDYEKLKGYRQAGINRLSMGLQSACDEELAALGRIHSYSDFLDNFKAARKAGFSNINVDLMSALPGQTLEGWQDTLSRVAALSPEHISAYSLIIEEGTPFWERYGEENGAAGRSWPALPGEDEERLMYERTEQILEGYGYHRYEISNYAKEGKECRHNKSYWQRIDYLGLGVGAASLAKDVRWKVTSDLETYLDDPAGCLKEELQPLTRAERMEEFMFLGLRMTEGVCLSDFEKQFGIGMKAVYGPVLERFVKEGLLIYYNEEKRLKLTPKGVDVSNWVLAEFLLEEDAAEKYNSAQADGVTA